jgi:hypothetical protein
MHGPTCIFWANLTPFSLKVRREKLKYAKKKEKAEAEKVKKWEAEREVVVQYVERLRSSLKTGRPRQLPGLSCSRHRSPTAN